MNTVSKKKGKKMLYMIPSVFLILILVFMLGKATLGALEKMLDSRAKRKEAEKELFYMQKRYEDLQRKVGYLETEKGTEDAIRSKFNVAKDGEKVFVITEDMNTNTSDIFSDENGLFDKFLDMIHRWFKD